MWFALLKSLFYMEFGSPSMPAPQAPAPDPTKSPEAIAARQAAERQAEIDASAGRESTINAGRKIAYDEQQQKAGARAKLGYGS